MLKKIYIFLALIVPLAFMAEAKAELKIATVNFDTILKTSKAGAHLNEQLKKELDEIRAEAENARKGFEGEVQKLNAQRSLITQEALQKKVTELQGKQQAKQQELNDKVRAVETAARNAQQKIVEQVVPIIEEITQKDKINVILEERFIFYTDTDLRITDGVIKKLDRKLKRVKLEIADQ
ncbi:MAG: OmpH family outer membrane protein [Parvibaculales bacterium]